MKKKVVKNGKLSPEIAKQLYLALVRCRKFEEKIVELYPQQEMRCPVHLSLGQEAVAAGVCVALNQDDVLFSTHRCHSHTIAKGASFNALMAELYGKEGGCCRGKGGSMHFLDVSVGAFGSSAIVGASAPLAVGAALAAKMQEKDFVSVAFFGDGAVEQGTFHESLNFASLKKLPVLFVCENNFLATCSHISARQPFDDIYRRALAYDIPGVQVDGTKAEEVYSAAKEAVERARQGKGPTLIEARCYRWKEHVGPNFDYNLGYRTQEELEKAMSECPVKLFETYLQKNKILPGSELSSIAEEVEKELNHSVTFAKESPFPVAQEIYEDI